ncbi:unnamed protein product [Acanthosepion pharaonis]|uniref:Uncharacterized protein n=1 Tax=Acanthosepion pharaonis TaxID=158019 RepID=A0A812AS93_ACAPH|nr:unnamed protein product [Sepia pharaonis]
MTQHIINLVRFFCNIFLFFSPSNPFVFYHLFTVILSLSFLYLSLFFSSFLLLLLFFSSSLLFLFFITCYASFLPLYFPCVLFLSLTFPHAGFLSPFLLFILSLPLPLFSPDTLPLPLLLCFSLLSFCLPLYLFRHSLPLSLSLFPLSLFALYPTLSPSHRFFFCCCSFIYKYDCGSASVCVILFIKLSHWPAWYYLHVPKSRPNNTDLPASLSLSLSLSLSIYLSLPHPP